MSDYGLKFDHAGASEPPPLPVAVSSDVSPHGWAGQGGSFHTADTTNEVGYGAYGDLASAARDAALSKRDAEQSVLNQ